MVSSTIGLRFRDTTLGVNTIEAHREILAREGKVWWGWWKKDFEDDFGSFLSSAPKELVVLIVDRSTSRMFKARASERLLGTGSFPDLGLVPEYYRSAAKQVYGWFLFDKIDDVAYDPTVGNKFGDGTFVIIDNVDTPAAHSAPAIPGKKSEKSSILHISDLHFGKYYDYLLQSETPTLGSTKKTLTECIFSDLQRIGASDDIEAIVVTGDFTSNGEWSDQTTKSIVSELGELSGRLGVARDCLLALPGNHDIERYPADKKIDVASIAVANQTSFAHERDFRFFLSELTGNDPRRPLNYATKISLKQADLSICMLNSCRILATEWTEYGYVGPTGVDVIEQLKGFDGTRPTFKLMAMHHHLLPVSDVEAPNKNGVTLSLDASLLLEKAQNAGVQIAIHGHMHMPRLARYQSIPLQGGEQHPPITVISNGSCGVSADRRPGGERNTYCLISFSDSDVELTMRELRSDARPGAQLYKGALSIKPFLPSPI